LGVTRWFSLAEQVEHVTAEIVKGRGGSKIAVVGHSIGAEIAMRAMAKHPNAIQKVVGLMPFVLTNERSKLQRFLASLVRVKPLVLFVASVVGFFKKVFPFFLNPATRGMDPDAKRLTKSWLRAGSVINMALMGRTEFDGLKDPRNDCDAANLETYAERVHLLYCEDDHWAPTWQAEAFKGRYAEADVAVFSPSSQEVKVEHAFVLSDAAADLVALRTAGMLTRR
jgi:pimeloyl-ACP methyl ester carboxylesterase